LKPFDGLAGAVAPHLARLLARSPWLPRLAAWQAGHEGALRRMIAATGSTLDTRGVETYRTLLRQPSHVAGALSMMAGWELAPLQRALPLIAAPVLLLHGEGDLTVPVAQSDEAAARLASAHVVRLARAGHLAHEEQPERVARLLKDWFLERELELETKAGSGRDPLPPLSTPPR
jgi:magnesium chelatase accessory protein